MAGHAPFEGPPDLTLAEAAALRDRARLLSLIEAGADPDAQAPVRSGLARRDVPSLTPLEAAIGDASSRKPLNSSSTTARASMPPTRHG